MNIMIVVIIEIVILIPMKIIILDGHQIIPNPNLDIPNGKIEFLRFPNSIFICRGMVKRIIPTEDETPKVNPLTFF